MGATGTGQSASDPRINLRGLIFAALLAGLLGALWFLETYSDEDREDSPGNLAVGPPPHLEELPIPEARIPLRTVLAQPEASGTEEAPAETAWTLRAEDEYGNGLTGADFYSFAIGDPPSYLGRSGSSGSLRTRLDLDRPTRVLAKLPGRATAEDFLLPGMARTKTFVLREAGTISGRVVLPSGASVDEGIRVVARRHGESHTPESIEPLREWENAPFTATTARDGSFAIDDLDPRREYVLTAGGRGLATLSERWSSRPNAEDSIVLEVSPVYGILLLTDGAQGSWMDKEALLVATPPEGTHQIGRSQGGINLSGLPQSLGRSPGESLLLFAHQDHSQQPERVGPVLIHQVLPGYDSKRVTLWAEPISEGIPVHRIELTPWADGFGDLILTVNERLVSTLDSSSSKLGAILLTRTEQATVASHGRLRTRLDELRRGSQRIKGIPHGTYSVSVRFQNGGYVWPQAGQEEVLVHIAEEPTTLELPLEQTGSLAIEVQYTDGSPFLEHTALILGEGEPVYDPDGSYTLSAGGGSVSFEHAPYRLFGLSPGKYTIIVSDPPQDEPLAPTIVEVKMGEPTVAYVRLNRER